MSEPTPHITLDILADYFAEQLEDEQEERVELHLADCDRCATNAQWVHSLPRPNLESWTAEAHGQATLRAFLETSLATAEREKPALKKRLLRWREHLTSGAKEVHLIKEASGSLTRGLDILMPPPGWELAARTATIGGGAPAQFKSSDPLCAERPEDETPTVRVVQRGIGIEVQVEDLKPSQEPRLVALIPTREGGQIKVQALRLTGDEHHTWIARFEKDDDFIIVFEPTTT